MPGLIEEWSSLHHQGRSLFNSGPFSRRSWSKPEASSHMAPNQQKGPLRAFLSSTIMRTRAGATWRHKLPSYLSWRPWLSSSFPPISTKYKVITLVYSQTPGVWRLQSHHQKTTKRSPFISHIKKQLEETKAARKNIKIHWIPAHRGITGNEKIDELAKHSIRHRRESQIPIPGKDMKSLWRKKSKEESQLWNQEMGQVRGQQHFYVVHW